MASPVTLDELVATVGISLETLDQKCTDEHTRTISEFLDWRRVAPYLELDDAAIQVIERDSGDEPQRRLKTLQKWKERFAFKATYKMLVEVLLTVGRADHAEKVCKLLPKRGTCLNPVHPIAPI